MFRKKNKPKTVYGVERLIDGLTVDGKDIKKFYREIVTNPMFYFPVIVLSIMAYLPSLANTKRQFEDFHMERYIGKDGVMKTGRWWMWLLGQGFSLSGNDIANKYLGLLCLILGALMITGTFYCLTEKKGVLKYTIMAVTIIVFPLINEIWSYNLANLLVCFNYLLCGVTVYFVFMVNVSLVRKLFLSTLPFVLISSSYESGLFLYITLVFSLCAYLCVIGKLRVKEYFCVGIFLAVPLIIGTGVGSLIGHFIAAVTAMPFSRSGDTRVYWGRENAFQNLMLENFDRYFLRALIYVPIAVFVFAVFIWTIVLLKALLERKGMVFCSGILLFLSLFILSMCQGSFLPYRTAQNVTIFTAFVFFMLIERSEGHRKLFQGCMGVLMMLISLVESSFLLEVNLIDYQNAHNDEDLVRQIGYDLTAHYYGKPVIIVGHCYDEYNLYSKVLHDKIIVDTSTWNGELYNYLREKIVGSSANGMKYFDTNLWSVLFLAVLEASSLEQFFSYCGYDITVIPYYYISDQYPEVEELIQSGALHPLEIVDMGEYVVVGL